MVLVVTLIFHGVPRWGNTNVLIFTGICSLMGSLSVNHLIPFVNMLFKFKYPSIDAFKFIKGTNL